jgi:hypothetical protein
VRNCIPSSVYVMASACGLVKIGRSNQPAHRARVLGWERGKAVALAYATEIRPDASVVEAVAHQSLAEHRAHGEWFAVPVNDAIATVMRAANKRTRAYSASGAVLMSDEPKRVRPPEPVAERQSISLRLPRSLDDWVRRKAIADRRSLTLTIELMLEAIRKEERANRND